MKYKQPKDPFPIYKDGQTQIIHGIDYSAWAAQGWSLEQPLPEEPAPEPVLITVDPQFNQPSPYQKRKAQLESLLQENQGWRNIERIGKELGITKPASGWDDAIPLILEKEGLQP